MSINAFDSIVVSDNVGIYKSALTIEVSDEITVTERILSHYRGIKWYREKNTVYMTEKGTAWRNKNGTTFQTKNRTNWYDKLNTSWKETNE